MKSIKTFVIIASSVLILSLSFISGAYWMFLRQSSDQLTLSLENSQILRSGKTAACIQRTEAISDGMILNLYRYQSSLGFSKFAFDLISSLSSTSLVRVRDGKSTAKDYLQYFPDAKFSDDSKFYLDN